jgi:hypothetical protein
VLTFVKKAIQKSISDTSILDLLDRNLSGMRSARSHKTIHVSDLTKDKAFCPREFALLDVLKRKPKADYINTAQQVAFDNGKALHDLVRNVWLENEVVGSWKCLFCSTVIPFSKKPKGFCGNCNRKHWIYEEEVFVDSETKVSGSIDFFLDFGLGRHVPCECKSIDKDQFAELKAPVGDHRARSQIYLYVISKSGRPEIPKIETTHARILYVSKGYGKKSEVLGKILPFKEFVIERNDSMAMAYLKTVKPLAAFREGKGKMPSGICVTGLEKRAKICSCVKECFSGQYPEGV